MWTQAEFTLFQKYVFIVLVPIAIVVGSIGSILNVIVFSISTKLRKSPCSLYLIFSSIGFMAYLNVVALLKLLQVGFAIDPSVSWSWFCKLKFYFVGFLLMLPRTYLALAGIDRYLMSISNQHRLSSRKVAVKVIIITCLFWMIICIHIMIFYDVLTSSNGLVHTCSSSPGAYSTFLSFYSVFINGLSMPLLMTIFGVLTVRNLQRHRNQIQDNNTVGTFQRRKKQEYVILRMLLVQLIVNIILTLPVTFYLCYSGLTQYTQKSSFRIFIENYTYNFFTLLQYISAAVSFYVYSFTSNTFRTELFYILSHFSIAFKRRVIDQSAVLMTRMGHSLATHQ
ncbi:unnamed protein product [Adineta steineri]|uniref:G-protein coupled receptors family 1 profile domain-containing protein n=1 Tax=Adineta steineri TaxID=433720 RepID=A0A815ELX7_9BILA|nr:unnamed protein product [Adineta steineri]CAF3909868.1 unnamed protein product [Adineta steineri]